MEKWSPLMGKKKGKKGRESEKTKKRENAGNSEPHSPVNGGTAAMGGKARKQEVPGSNPGDPPPPPPPRQSKEFAQFSPWHNKQPKPILNPATTGPTSFSFKSNFLQSSVNDKTVQSLACMYDYDAVRFQCWDN